MIRILLLVVIVSFLTGCVEDRPNLEHSDPLVDPEDDPTHWPGEDLDGDLEESKTYQDAEELREEWNFDCDEEICD